MTFEQLSSQHTRDDGYVGCTYRDHPVLGTGRDLLHRVIMAELLGRPLNGREEQVHHIDGNKANNEPSNLALVGLRKHSSYHSCLNWSDPDFYARSVAAFRESCARSELRVDRRRAALEAWKSEQYQQNHRASMRSEETRKRLSVAAKKHFEEKDTAKKIHRSVCCAACGRELNGNANLTRHLNRKQPCNIHTTP